jgi:class 3 adenylate cyclase/tetratricopeptide (TPR) repeat protein/ribosomal protein L40E
MICQQCGKKNDLDAVFCVQCSHPLLKSCPSCSTQNSADATFCKKCGAALDTTIHEAQSSRLQQLRDSAPTDLQEKLRLMETQIEGQRKPVTILFTDIVDSTAIAERLDPEEWKEIIQGAHHRVSEAIHHYEGTIAQLLGDGVMAFFGAPLTHEDDPERAVRAGLDIQSNIAEYRQELAGFVDDFHMRVGIHTGEVVVGPVGTDKRTEYLAIGDAVNIAARLEGAAEPDQVLISERCAKFIEHTFKFGAFESMKFKGKSDPMRVVTVLELEPKPRFAHGLGGVQTPFVGREEELAQLQEALLQLCQGHGGIITLIGEAGIGKTRLLEHARETMGMLTLKDHEGYFAQSTLHWLESRALSYGGSLSFWMINQLLLDDLGLRDGSPQMKIKAALRRRLVDLFGEDQITRMLPFLSHLLGVAQVGREHKLIEQMSGESIKLQIMIHLAEYFERIAERSPTVIVLEDLHWADPSSLETIHHLLPLTDRVPLTFVLLMRIEPDHGVWVLKSSADRDLPHRMTEIHLRRLGNRESQMLVEQLLRPEVIPKDLQQLILTRSEGNPLYLEEVVRHLLESELILEREGQWIASDQIVEIGLPETLQGVLLARIDRLEEDVRDTLQMASVIGKSFLFKVLQAIAEAEHQLELHLTQLQRVDLVREKTRFPELEYMFKHSLTQEAAYNSLLIERRKAFHLKVGEAIEELFSDRIDEFLGLLAHHFSKANSHVKAGDYLVRAGDKAYDETAIEEAIGYYIQAKHIYTQLDNKKMLGRLETWLGVSHWARGDRQTSLEHLQRALSILEQGEETIELAEVLSQLSRMHMMASQYDDAIAQGEKALELATRLGSMDICAHMLNTLGSSHCGKGDMEKGLAMIAKSLQLSLDSDLKFSVLRAYFNLGEYLVASGKYEEALANYKAYREYSIREGNEISAVFAQSCEAHLNWLRGRWERVFKVMTNFRDKLVGIWNVWAHIFYGKMENDLGRGDKSMQALEKLLSVALSSKEIQTTVPYLGELARAHAGLGRDEDSDQTIDQYLSLIDGNPYFDKSSSMPLLFSCRWYARGKDKSAVEKCLGSVDRLRKMHTQFHFPETKAAFEEGSGYLSLAEEKPAQAVEQFRNALEIWRTLGRPYDQARVLGSLGHALVAVNDRSAAIEVYDQALQLLGNLADQLEDVEVRETFQNSQLVIDIRQGRAATEVET